MHFKVLENEVFDRWDERELL